MVQVPRLMVTPPQLRAASLMALGLLFVAPGLAAINEAGRLLFRDFTPEDYRGEVQVSDVVQTSDGLIYLATLGAIKEYDGLNWRTIPVAASWIMDLCAAEDGRVYIAGVDELGFLEIGPQGRREFRSILEHVPAELKPLGQQWTVVYREGAAFWATNHLVLRWKNGELRTWALGDEGRNAVYDGGRYIYVSHTERGLFRHEGDEWRLISTEAEAKRLPGLFLDDWGVDGVTFPDREGHLWLVGAGGRLVERPSNLSDAIAEVPGARVIDAVRLRDGRLAVTSKNAGVIVLGVDAQIELRFGTDGALDASNLFGGCEDLEGGLWVGMGYGCVRIELDPSLTVFDHKNGGPPGGMYRLIRHDGVLFACGEDGLYRFTPGPGGRQGRYERVPSQAQFFPYDLLSHRSGVLIASDRGLFRFANGEIKPEFQGQHSIYTLIASTSDPDRIFVSGTEFINTLRWDGASWVDEGMIAESRFDGRSLVEDEQGVLWMGTPSRGVVRIRRQPGRTDWQSATVDHFDDTRGLPEGHDWVSAHATAVGPLFAHARGVSAYDPGSDRMVPAAAFEAAGLGGRYTFPLASGRGAIIWAQLGQAAAGEKLELGGVIPAAGGRWEWKPLPDIVYSELGYMGAGDFWWEAGARDEGILWILGQKSILRWDLGGALGRRALAAPAVVFRAVGRGGVDFPLAARIAARLPFAREPLRARFVSPTYAPASGVEYQYRLVGYDDRWSEWSAENEAAFTNLGGGDYSLEVRARRAGGDPGPVAAWNFAVLSPWWRTPGAIAGYVLAGLGLGWLVLRWRLSFLLRERQRLEAVVRERTDELALARDRAEAANQAKTMFLASMSHELRTPLHAILGYAQLLADDRTLPDPARNRLEIVRGSGQHLLRLINEVLDLSKIEAGKLELRSEPFDLPGLLQEIVQAHESRAAAKGIEMRFPDVDGLPGVVHGDAHKLRQVLDNLLGNAVKFTQEGEVRLSVMPMSGTRVHFEVSDSGPGIAPDDAKRLFQPFTQAEEPMAHEEAGTGLGLVIAQRLVAMMGGELRLASVVGEGSRFWFEICLSPAVKPVRDRTAGRRLVGYEGPRCRVLAVDDIEANRLLFRDLLAPLGFEVALASGAEEALSLLDSVRPDLVLLDLRMPGMGGLALARILRSDPRLEGVKILAASASVFGQDPGEALAAGCDGFIHKPFLPEDFLVQVGHLLALTWREVEPSAAVKEALDPQLVAELLEAARLGDLIALREALGRLRARHPEATAVVEIERAIDQLDTERVVRIALSQLEETQEDAT